MSKNYIRKTFVASSTWDCPAGVKNVVVSAVLERAQLITAGGTVGGGVLYDGTPYAWGGNNSGQVGDLSVTPKSSPVLVSTSKKFRQICAASTHTLALADDGDAYSWGDNTSGRLGDGTVVPKSSPTLVAGGHKFKYVSANQSMSGNGYGITLTGDLYAWGAGTSGQLGNGSTAANVSSPVLVSGGLKWKQVSGSLALTEDGAAYAWGFNGNGRLGDGTTVNKSTPSAVVGGLTFKQVSQGWSHCLALTEDGVAYAWGLGSNGQLGDGLAVTQASSPILVAGGHTFAKLGAGTSWSAGLTTAGQIYAWGYNPDGRLGDGTVNQASTPTLVLGGHTFIDIAVGGTFILALKDNGDLYAWGDNSNGQLGDGSVASKSSPVLVAGSKAWSVPGEETINRLLLDVVPGTTYNITFGGMIRFGSIPVAVHEGKVKIVLEYDA